MKRPGLVRFTPKPAELRNRDNGVEVRVRIVWDRDGEEYVEGVATRWDADHVYV